MPTAGRIQIFPIKGLDPVCVAEAEVLGPGALAFDRRWALVDSQGRLVSGKTCAAIHGVRAEYDLAKFEVALNGTVFSLKEAPAMERWLSDLLGEAVAIRENEACGFPDDTDSPGPTLVSQASLAQVGEWFGLPLEEVRRRFRTNIEIDGVEPFWEDRLYGSDFRIGGVTFHAVNPCQRCVVPSRNPWTGSQDAGFQKRFAERRQSQLPEWAVSAPFNHFYRFAVNTRLVARGSGRIHTGQLVS
jgi:uncharacterized protein YcbX